MSGRISIVAIHHGVVIVSNVRCSQQFYTKVLSFKNVACSEPRALLHNDSCLP
jgi:hypothetical protein